MLAQEVVKPTLNLHLCLLVLSLGALRAPEDSENALHSTLQ